MEQNPAKKPHFRRLSVEPIPLWQRIAFALAVAGIGLGFFYVLGLIT